MVTVTAFQAITMMLFVLVCIIVTYLNTRKLVAYRRQVDEIGKVFVYLNRSGILRAAKKELPLDAAEIDVQVQRASKAFTKLAHMG